jgi:Fic family protein
MIMDVNEQVPEPLRTLDATAIAPILARLQAAQAGYHDHRDSGRILPNSVEALRIELTYHSNAIEGSTLTLRETQLVIEGRAPASGKSMRELYEARNHDLALRLIERWAAMRPASAPIAEEDLLAVHAQVMADIDAPGAGRFRSERVLIKGTSFIPPGSQKFDELIPALLALANRAGVEPPVQAAELHYNLVAVHPFADGNGRTARLMMNYHLLRNGFPPAIIEVERRGEYLAALEEANEGRCEPFGVFILGCIERSITRLIGGA